MTKRPPPGRKPIATAKARVIENKADVQPSSMVAGRLDTASGVTPRRASLDPKLIAQRVGTENAKVRASKANAIQKRASRIRAPTGAFGGKKVDPNILVKEPWIPPLVLQPDPNGNFFDSDRAGRAVVRPEDLLLLRIELQNLKVQAGDPPRLKKTGRGDGFLILHFPPQAITEQTFFETKPVGFTNPQRPDGSDDKPDPPGDDSPAAPPIRARISGESRLAFAVPDDFDVPYTLAGILEAVEQLQMSVSANALPPGAGQSPVRFSDLFVRDLGRLSITERTALTSFAMRSLRIAAVQGDAATLGLRHAGGAAGLATLNPDTIVKRGLRTGADFGRLRRKARPAPPDASATAIELPWRLILSPHAAERWQHAKALATSPDGHTELWHSRLVGAAQQGGAPATPDPQASVRAVWALSGEGSTKAMQGKFPTAPVPPATIPPDPKAPPATDSPDLPDPQASPAPFRMPLDDFDRFQIAHLSSNFSMANYQPNAIGANLLMLSALGGWLDARGAWDPPGLSVEEWVHRASMGRDHYVRVVYKGFLFPFGHSAALVKVSERKFHANIPGRPNTAYLRQRLFIIVREPERRFVDPSLKDRSGNSLSLQFPFTRIRLVTTVTPDLEQPSHPQSAIAGSNDHMFWPCVNGDAFKFQCVATDIDGRVSRFGLPMIFMDNTLASPRTKQGNKLVPQFDAAEANAAQARAAWKDPARAGRRVASFNQQRVTFAPSVKAGDTALQADDISFDGFVDPGNAQLRSYSEGLSHPVFYPQVASAHVRIPALAQLTGNAKNNTIVWNPHYKKNGFTNNQGQVFANVNAELGMAQLDFSSQGDRAGGFVQPNLVPSAISRLTGPVTGNVDNFIAGQLDAKDAFPASLSGLPLPLLFGCIPLGEVIQTVEGLADKPGQIPKFASEASTQVESFLNGLIRLFELVTKLADQPGRAGEAALAVARQALGDLSEQAEGYAAPLMADVKARIAELHTALDKVSTQLAPLFDSEVNSAPTLSGLSGALNVARNAANTLRAAADTKANGVSMPSGLRQALLQMAQQIEDRLVDLGTIATLITQGKKLYVALDALVGHPEQLGDLLADAGKLATRLTAVMDALGPLRATLAASRLLDGAARQAILAAMDAATQIMGTAANIANLLQMLTGDELTVRFDWAPLLKDWALPGASEPLFRVHDQHGFLVAVEAKVKKNGQSAPKISVNCSLKSFDLVLVAPASFIELNFEKIEFRVESSAKMDVDVRLSGIKFVGPLSFVETLRDLIPLDGFSDPPHLDITPKGIDAGFSIALPNIAIGVFSLSNLSLGAGFTVPFIGQPLSVRFNFCTREQPFNLTVTLFGGGGFFGITLDPHGIQLLEAAFEFGASVSIDFGVASGGVYVMAGIYFRMEKDACSLTGYFRLGGHVSVLGLISASLELYLALAYGSESGKCAGIARLTIEVEVFMFSTSVTITCERKFAGSNGDPGFRDLMGADPARALDKELQFINPATLYPWREYCEAFA